MVSLGERINQQLSNQSIRAALSETDMQRFLEATSSGTETLQGEQFNSDLYLDEVISKPWGLEFRVFADNFYDVWKLTLLPGKSTSMHCHPRKETSLLCLGGKGRITFVNVAHTISVGDVVHIPKGVFHATENIGDSTLELVEVESPRNKFDLVRIADRYGRSGKRYEQETLQYEVPDMQSLVYSSGAKLRNKCHQNRFRFGVKGALELICRETPGLMFVVPLSLKNAFLQNIQVFNTVDDLDLSEEIFYFTISENS
jgi:mannose-6-phosphate isomerase-like protein (cupin superfamily)